MKISTIVTHLFSIILCLLCQTAFPQASKNIADSIAHEHFKDTTNVGLSIGVISNGVLKNYDYGGKYSKNIEDVDKETLFEIGSVTKLYTSFLLATLEAENKISRYDLLSKHLPAGMTTGKQWATKIRLVDLATHTSGLPQFESTKSIASFDGFDENNPYGLFTNPFMLDILESIDTIPDYGQIKYSNFGIGLLGYAMAQSEKTSFENLFKKYITKPYGLTSTFLKVNEQSLTNIAIPHRKSESMPLIQLAGMGPAGSIKTTMSDLLRFLNLHLKKRANVKQIVDIVLKNQLKDSNQAVGLGWGIHTVANETVYFHNGGTYGSSSIVIIVPSKMIGVAILSNNSSEGQLTSFALKMIQELMK